MNKKTERVSDKVAVIGSATIDHIVQGTQSSTKIGGVVTYAGLTYRKQGYHVSVVSNISDGEKELIRMFARAEVLRYGTESQTTTHFVNHLERDQRVQEMPLAARAIELQPVLMAMMEAQLIHLGPLHPDDLDLSVYQALTNSDCLVGLDLQGFTRAVRSGRVVAKVSDKLREALLAADIVMASQEDLQQVKKAWDVNEEELLAESRIKELIVTAGSAGGTVYVSGKVPHSFNAVPVEQVVDTTGAGDVFFASYLKARVLEDQTIQDACMEAASIAALHVSGRWFAEGLLNLSRD